METQAAIKIQTTLTAPAKALALLPIQFMPPKAPQPTYLKMKAGLEPLVLEEPQEKKQSVTKSLLKRQPLRESPGPAVRGTSSSSRSRVKPSFGKEPRCASPGHLKPAGKSHCLFEANKSDKNRRVVKEHKKSSILGFLSRRRRDARSANDAQTLKYSASESGEKSFILI